VCQLILCRRFIIDSHHHFDPAPGYLDRLVRIYGPRNAMACVLTRFPHLETVRKAAQAHPDVIIPYGQINVDDVGAVKEIRQFAAAGFRGIKMHTPRHNWDDFSYFPLYEVMQSLGLIALFHTGIVSGSSDDPEPSWYEEAAEAARWEKNLYFDLTGSSLLKKSRNLGVFRDYLWWEGPSLHSSKDAVYAFEKIVFGTDEPPENLDAVMGQFERMLDACAVPEESRKKIYGGTMARILGIKGRV
jgi:predicted TIM-barrel fold metal-dependent hydrolase